MNKIKTGLNIILLLLSFQLSAFQGSGTAEKEALELLSEHEKEAERLYLEGRTVEAIQKFEAVQKKYREIGLTENAIDLYEDLFAALIQNDNFELSFNNGIPMFCLSVFIKLNNSTSISL